VAGILARPQFWIMVLFFSLAVGVSLGSYTMVPLYLVAERGFERELANTLLSVSRISGLGMAFVAGWLTDRLGPKQTMAVYFLLAGAFTVLLGLAPGNLVAVPVLLQPLLVGVFFPAGFTAVSRVFDQSLRSLAVGFITPVSATLGAGLVPAALGWAGDRGSFAAGFVVLGCALLAGAAALKLLSIPASGRDGE
jgi:NNP family nitrate/nitrite transporter-like MFS transporter